MAQPASRHTHITEPEFCPNPACIFHDRRIAQLTRWFQPFGHFDSKCRGPIPRFICSLCGKTCSTQTFSIHYWTHSTLDMGLIDERFYAGSGYRQIGRDLKLGYRVLKNRYQRIARNYLNLYDAFLEKQQFRENAAFDGFESFVRSQYFPVNYHIMVGSNSLFPYMVNAEILKRKGRMTKIQRANRDVIAKHWKPRQAGIKRSCKSLFTTAAGMLKERDPEHPWIIDTDMKKEYPYAMKEVKEFNELMEKRCIIHRQTSSRKARTIWNYLFPVNYIDRELRKNAASHVRETTRQDREINMAMVRMVSTLGHHAFRKPFRIDNKTDVDGDPTHSLMTGVIESAKSRWAFERLYTHRHVWTHQAGKHEWMRMVWKAEYKNPPIVNFKTGEKKDSGQPGDGWFPAHLAA